MAGSKREKKIKQKATPKGQHIAQGGDPGQYYSQTPAWAFTNADTEKGKVTIPFHCKDLTKAVENSIMKQAGLK